MGLDDTTEPRVVARNLASEDPSWGQVAAFLDAADTAYGDAASPTQQAVHLAAISQAAREAPVRKQPSIDANTRRRGRTAVGATLAAFVLITGGVTAAGAFGGLFQPKPATDPASILMDAAPDPTETKSGEEGDDADDQAKPKAPGKVHPARTGTSSKPAARPPAPTTTTHHDDRDDDDDHESSEHHEDSEDESDD